MLVSVRDEIGLTAIAKMSYVCSMRDKAFAEVGIPTLCTDSPESRVCTWASDMEFLGPSMNTSVLSRQQAVFVKSWLCTSGQTRFRSTGVCALATTSLSTSTSISAASPTKAKLVLGLDYAFRAVPSRRFQEPIVTFIVSRGDDFFL